MLILLVAIAGLTAVWSSARLNRERQSLQDAERTAQITADIEAMRAADQGIRKLFLGKVQDSEPRTAQREAELNAERERLDREHVARLSSILDEIGRWPGPPRFDDRTAQSACVIAVHAVADLAFMERARDLMGAALASGGANVECWAQVTDRVLVQTGQPQRFGTQLRGADIDGVFHWGIAPLEDADTLLSRRAAVGLGEYGEYLARQRHDYRIPDSAPPFPDEPVIPGL